MPAAGLRLFLAHSVILLLIIILHTFSGSSKVLTPKQWNINQKSWTIKRRTQKNDNTFL